MAKTKNAPPVESAEEKKPEPPAAPKKQKPLTEEQVRIADSRKSLESPLAEGMAFFESPEGYIIVAESTRPHVWCGKANDGKGMFINPKR